MSQAMAPVCVPGAVGFDLPSQITGRTYRIFIYQPPVPPPRSGYPVVVVTDANLTFPIAAAQSGAFALRDGKAALVVGVGYAADDLLSPLFLRNRDLTPPTAPEGLPQAAGRPADPDHFGGSGDFYRFLVEELQPAIAEAYAVDPDDQTLYGHSLAGLFVLGVLFNHPEAFRNFVASSPSIWWDDRAVLDDAPAFARRVRAGEVAPRVLILVGDREQLPPEAPLPGLSAAETEQVVCDARMVDNAYELGGRLEALRGPPGYEARFHAFEDEDHLTALPASISRALAFAIRAPAA